MAKIYHPVEPVNKKLFLQLKLSIDPRDIPLTKSKVPITHERILAIQLEKEVEAAKAIKLVEDKYKPDDAVVVDGGTP